MRQFIKKIVWFTSSGLMIIAFVFVGTRFIEINFHKNTIPANTVAVLGNSHTKTAVHDSLLSVETNRPVKNFGVNGQSMFWTIIAARKLYHQGVRNFVIELNNGSYTSGWKTTDPARGGREFMNKHFLTTEEWKFLWKRDPKFTSKLLLHVYWPSGSVNGSFQALHAPFRQKVVAENRSKLDEDSVQVDFDDNLLHQFIAIHPDAHIFVIRAPLHPGYFDNFTNDLEVMFQEKLNAFKRYDNVRVFDFGHNVTNNMYFADFGHMNYQGALHFTPQLADAINEVTLD